MSKFRTASALLAALALLAAVAGCGRQNPSGSGDTGTPSAASSDASSVVSELETADTGEMDFDFTDCELSGDYDSAAVT